MKSKTIPIVLTFVILIAAITFVHMWMNPKPIEAFNSQSEGACNAYKSCADCADDNGCGWCASTKKCHAKGRFGDSDGKCDARSFTTFKEQCSATSSGVATAGGSTYNAGREKRRLNMIKKYVDRVGTNYNALTLASSKEDARDYIKDKLAYSDSNSDDAE